MTDEKIIAALREVHRWAKGKTHEGIEPPWAWFQYMKLIEAIESVFNGINSTIPMASLQQLNSHLGNGSRLVEGNFQQDIAQPLPSDVLPRLPM